MTVTKSLKRFTTRWTSMRRRRCGSEVKLGIFDGMTRVPARWIQSVRALRSTESYSATIPSILLTKQETKVIWHVLPHLYLLRNFHALLCWHLVLSPVHLLELVIANLACSFPPTSLSITRVLCSSLALRKCMCCQWCCSRAAELWKTCFETSAKTRRHLERYARLLTVSAWLLVLRDVLYVVQGTLQKYD
jgi:hypothetical protein